MGNKRNPIIVWIHPVVKWVVQSYFLDLGQTIVLAPHNLLDLPAPTVQSDGIPALFVAQGHDAVDGASEPGEEHQPPLIEVLVQQVTHHVVLGASYLSDYPPHVGNQPGALA